MNRNLQIIAAWTGAAALIAGAYHERLGLPIWFEDFAALGVMPAVLLSILLLRRYGRDSSRDKIGAAGSRGKLQRLWEHKPNRVWFAAVIMGLIAATSFLIPPNSHMALRDNPVISLFAIAFGVAVVFIAVRWRRH